MVPDLPFELDPNIWRLVRALNAFPGISTFSSCGGHRRPESPSQCPAETFEVQFNVYPPQGGWRSLELIASAVSDTADHDKLTLTVWSRGGGTSVCFELAGRDQRDPDGLAEELARIHPIFDEESRDE